MSERPSGYEKWVGDAYLVPFIGSRPRAPRGWPVILAVCVAIWVMALRLTPVPVEWRTIGAIALLVTGTILTYALVMSGFVMAERAHHWLLARPELGNWRVLLWLGFFAGWLFGWFAFALVMMVLVSA